MSKQTYTARELLTFLYSECKKWEVDYDGEYIEARPINHTTHHIALKESTLEDLLELAGIPNDPEVELPIETLKRAAREDEAKFRAEHERTADARAEASRLATQKTD